MREIIEKRLRLSATASLKGHQAEQSGGAHGLAAEHFLDVGSIRDWRVGICNGHAYTN